MRNVMAIYRLSRIIANFAFVKVPNRKQTAVKLSDFDTFMIYQTILLRYMILRFENESDAFCDNLLF